eukprot:46268-Eustigmatos_ZCMA.PRE.1
MYGAPSNTAQNAAPLCLRSGRTATSSLADDIHFSVILAAGAVHRRIGTTATLLLTGRKTSKPLISPVVGRRSHHDT